MICKHWDVCVCVCVCMRERERGRGVGESLKKASQKIGNIYLQ